MSDTVVTRPQATPMEAAAPGQTYGKATLSLPSAPAQPS
jgi:hypothetical protein